MRPIDADALIEKCGGWYVEEGTESGFIGTLENLLATEPTIQPVANDTNDGEMQEMKQEFLRMAGYIDVLLNCSDEQKETLLGFISRMSEFMPWTQED